MSVAVEEPMSPSSPKVTSPKYAQVATTDWVLMSPKSYRDHHRSERKRVAAAQQTVVTSAPMYSAPLEAAAHGYGGTSIIDSRVPVQYQQAALSYMHAPPATWVNAVRDATQKLANPAPAPIVTNKILEEDAAQTGNFTLKA